MGLGEGARMSEKDGKDKKRSLMGDVLLPYIILGVIFLGMASIFLIIIFA